MPLLSPKVCRGEIPSWKKEEQALTILSLSLTKTQTRKNHSLHKLIIIKVIRARKVAKLIIKKECLNSRSTIEFPHL